jgi:hypothetical protein
MENRKEMNRKNSQTVRQNVLNIYNRSSASLKRKNNEKQTYPQKSKSLINSKQSCGQEVIPT